MEFIKHDANRAAVAGNSPGMSEAIPRARNLNDPTVQRGKELFYKMGCTSCHRPKWETGDDNYWLPQMMVDKNYTKLPRYAHQTIYPYSDYVQHKLPFEVKLDNFQVDYHDGTTSPMDYETRFNIIDGKKTLNAAVSMNHIFTYQHYRIYQASFDTDNMGSYLSVNYDPWGIGVTYVGYALLFLSLILMLVLPGTS